MIFGLSVLRREISTNEEATDKLNIVGLEPTFNQIAKETEENGAESSSEIPEQHKVKTPWNQRGSDIRKCFEFKKKPAIYQAP